jgi:aspartate racemase
MKSKTIGILGGAGPQAGVALVERLIFFAQTKYGCKADADFPKIILNSFPFSNMLDGEKENPLVRKQLKKALSELRKSGAEILSIACNTLHIFLDEASHQQSNLIQLPSVVRQFLGSVDSKPVVLGTRTSARAKLHQKFFPCFYPKKKIQEEVDALIDHILAKGADMSARARLIAILNKLDASYVILGCTELSLLSNTLPNLGKVIVDPMDLLALEILAITFKQL